jgi:hypothetical protein
MLSVMVQNVIKWAIAGSLFSGAIIALFVFIGSLVIHLNSKIRKTSSRGRWIIRILLTIFILLMLMIIVISIKILLVPTDLHLIGDIFRELA